jgi:hypothetical protein
MAQPISRAELVTYVKTRLGDPVITINVSNTQIDQRIDDAIAVWQEYHFDGSETQYFKHQVTASNLVLNVASTGTFTNNEVIIGATSNVRGIVYTQANTTLVKFHYQTKPVVNSFSVSETITGQSSGATGVVNAISLGDWDNEYIDVANNIISINKVLPVGGGVGGERSSGLFSPIMSFVMGDIASLSGGGSATSYVLARQNMEMLHDLFVGDIDIRFNRHTNKLYLDIDWSTDLFVGDWIVAEAKYWIDGNTYPDMWSDRFLRDYATALVKKQWGQNLIKFSGTPMPGGISINGQAIYDEGVKEVLAIEEQMQNRFELPPRFIVA